MADAAPIVPDAAPVAVPVAATPPAAAPAPVADSLFKAAPVAPPAGTPAPGTPAPADSTDAPQWLPEKYRVIGADGKLDIAASGQKMNDGLAAAVKRIGTGDLPPDAADKYTYTVPDTLKDVAIDTEATAAFKAKAHGLGLTQGQFDGVMGEYFRMVPGLLDSAAKVSADQARVELQKVWATKAEFETQMNNGQAAINALPASLQAKVIERFGNDPLFAQVAAHLGNGMREDKPPGQGSGVAPADANILMASEAYRNPRHPEHQRVSQQVQQAFQRSYGGAPA